MTTPIDWHAREDARYADLTDQELAGSMRLLEQTAALSAKFASDGQTSALMSLGEMRRVLARRQARAAAPD